ncbi:LOW QUALITY PROTEIN: hypothetical protein PHMEG_0004607 [Phytophthora megakarya]|uniref:Uncharacterized protein n=1 Tax=Phytophthora megakarya TaxID=4795 RepID=A0A225WTG4_9STRA|nr:LOW QUALITY PROTEIN: hypothetical protein PHMEG_0004607 [Phytophthora megakarya]
MLALHATTLNYDGTKLPKSAMNGATKLKRVVYALMMANLRHDVELRLTHARNYNGYILSYNVKRVLPVRQRAYSAIMRKNAIDLRVLIFLLVSGQVRKNLGLWPNTCANLSLYSM